MCRIVVPVPDFQFGHMVTASVTIGEFAEKDMAAPNFDEPEAINVLK